MQWFSSKWLMVRYQSSAPRILYSAQSCHPPHGCGGALVPRKELKNTQKYYSMYSLRWNLDPRLHYCLTASLLILHFLPSLISYYVDVSFRIQGTSGKLSHAWFR